MIAITHLGNSMRVSNYMSTIRPYDSFIRCDYKVTDELESRFSDALDVLGEPSLSPSG